MPRSRGGQRSLGALDDLFIECRERAADAAHFGHDHSRVYLCGAVRIVIFWRGGLRRALAHSLKADRSDEPSNSARFLNAGSDVAFQLTNAAHRNRGMRDARADRASFAGRVPRAGYMAPRLRSACGGGPRGGDINEAVIALRLVLQA